MQEADEATTTNTAPPSSTIPEESNKDTTEKEIITFEPNATLYVSNIDWSIKKPILRRSLLSLFSRHGKVLEVVTLRREGLRGQAWIIFNDVASATAALRAENGFVFFNRPLKISYAREVSDRIAKRDGTYVPQDRRKKQQQQQLKKRVVGAASAASAEETTAGGVGGSFAAPETAEEGEGMEVATTAVADATDGGSPKNDGSSSGQKKDTGADDKTNGNNAPSNIIFAQNLPSECNEMMLAMLFRQYAGYKEVRIPRAGLAFVEFDDEPHATLALRGLNGFRLTTTDSLVLKYGKGN
eukprot:CAMPEP_0172497892 /NCGR_PEP_ID=MMETSP1066-20121228/106701_1 /TAXON_ID=671091 /ORGANISM="Coscinodiscus wailesii, Strain CCMP2513" /LENGTH=297 /DNA_ID=CAMNT_0013270917 /DNA_START=44 /DNA_END=937 /DNA_ORIENTATION=+